MTLEDENKFDFYVGDGIENLRNSEGWSDNKIALHLRRVANEISPRRKLKKINIPKEFVEEFIKKNKEVNKKWEKL